jgi:glycosyltransferase involved in cell wall biosynthesis
MTEIPKFAILSHALPPSPSGQAVMLYRILSGISPDDYYLISSAPRQDDQEGSQSLSAPYYELPPVRLLKFGFGFMREIYNLVKSVVSRSRAVVGILKEHPVKALIACSGDIVDIPAGFLASRKVGVDFYAYIFDDYAYQWVGRRRAFAKLISKFIFKNARGVIGPNEFICAEYEKRYGITPALVRNPYAESIAPAPFSRWPARDGIVRVMYTGAIYHANLDCFQNLIRAIASIREHPIELHLYTAQLEEQLRSQGIQGEKVFIHTHVPYKVILEQQQKADILFLPLAFESPIPEVIHTSAPGKMGEYLASGRPILAHVPHDSFVASYFRTYACGALTDQNDVPMLAAEIRKIIDQPSFRSEIIKNALRQATADFSPQLARQKFVEVLS